MVDSIPMTIQYHLLEELAARLRGAVTMIVTEDLEHLLSEDETVAFERQFLEEREERLHKAMHEITKF